MRPLSITLRGIGPHSETTIDFGRFDGGVVAVSGPTGTGKTTAISALVSALFGAAPLKGDLLATIKDTVSIGRSEPSSIDYTFSLPGRGTRRVSRTISKSAHKAEYFSVGPAGDELLAGPKVTDVERAIREEVGDLDTFLATAYCSRESAHDMICCKPSKRREAFGRFLNFAEYDECSSKMKEAARMIDAQADILEAQVKGSPDYTAIAAQKRNELALAINERDQAIAHIDDLNGQLEAARVALRDAQGGEDVLRAQIAAFDAALDEVSRIDREISSLKDELDALSRRAAGLAAAEAATAHLTDLRAAREALVRQRDQFARRQRWEQRRSMTKADLDRLDARLDALRSAPGVDAATIALAEQYQAIAQEYRTAEAKNAETTKRNEAFRRALAQYTGRRASVLDQTRALEARLAKKPSGLFGESCSPCQFLAEWAAIPGQIDTLKAEANTLTLAIEAAERQGEEPLIDLRPITERGSAAKAAKASVDAAKKTRDQIGETEQQRERIAEAYQVILQEEEPAVADPTSELDRTQKEIDEHQQIASGLEAARHAQADITRRSAALADLKATRLEAGKRLEEATKPATSAAQALKDRETQQAALKAKEADVLARLRAASSASQAAASKVGRLEAEILTAERQADEVASRAAQALEMRERIEELQWLAKCFGKTGIQPAIIDQYLPQLDELIDDVLAEMTNGRMRMRWVTQEARKDGSIAEGFSIVVRDEKGERDVSLCSGGETQILQAANRIGLALWLSQLRGVPCETLIFDEAANNIDDAGTEAFVRAIQRVSHRFALIVLITPKAEMARLVPQRIELEPRLRGVSVSYIGASAAAASAA